MTKPSKIDEKALFDMVQVGISNGDYVILPHARIRCSEREVSAADIEQAVEKGKRIKMRDRFNEDLQSWSYAYEGYSIDEELLRIINTFHQKLAIVTVVKIGGAE